MKKINKVMLLGLIPAMAFAAPISTQAANRYYSPGDSGIISLQQVEASNFTDNSFNFPNERDKMLNAVCNAFHNHLTLLTEKHAFLSERGNADAETLRRLSEWIPLYEDKIRQFEIQRDIILAFEEFDLDDINTQIITNDVHPMEISILNNFRRHLTDRIRWANSGAYALSFYTTSVAEYINRHDAMLQQWYNIYNRIEEQFDLLCELYEELDEVLFAIEDEEERLSYPSRTSQRLMDLRQRATDLEAYKADIYVLIDALEATLEWLDSDVRREREIDRLENLILSRGGSARRASDNVLMHMSSLRTTLSAIELRVEGLRRAGYLN